MQRTFALHIATEAQSTRPASWLWFGSTRLVPSTSSSTSAHGLCPLLPDLQNYPAWHTSLYTSTMATPLSSHRRRLANNSASTPARSSPLAKSPSTPYDVFRLQHNIPFTSTADHTYSSSPSSSSPSAFLHPSSPNAYAPYRRNVGFGSPGSAGRSPRTSQGPSSSHVSPSPGYDRLSSDGRGSKSSRFIRRKSMKQK